MANRIVDIRKWEKFEPEKTLQLVRRQTLTKGQTALLGLIDKKLKTEEKIFLSEVKPIWLKFVCKNVFKGIPHWYNYFHKRIEEPGKEVKWQGGYEPMNEWMLTSRLLLWLTSNIGSLVLKGYLKVIPAIELRQLRASL